MKGYRKHIAEEKASQAETERERDLRLIKLLKDRASDLDSALSLFRAEDSKQLKTT